MIGIITAIFGGRPGMISGATGAVAVIFAPLMIGYDAGVDTARAEAICLQLLSLWVFSASIWMA